MRSKNAVENILASASKSNKNYVQGHEADVKDVSTRVLRILARTWKDKMLTDEPFILAAGELYPSETVKFDKSKILGFVTRYGTINSHTAVLARTKGIPSVIGLGESLQKRIRRQDDHHRRVLREKYILSRIIRRFPR